MDHFTYRPGELAPDPASPDSLTEAAGTRAAEVLVDGSRHAVVRRESCEDLVAGEDVP